VIDVISKSEKRQSPNFGNFGHDQRGPGEFDPTNVKNADKYEARLFFGCCFLRSVARKKSEHPCCVLANE
jgi:hypothetical protein